jgi:hypothetical protein
MIRDFAGFSPLLFSREGGVMVRDFAGFSPLLFLREGAGG